MDVGQWSRIVSFYGNKGGNKNVEGYWNGVRLLEFDYLIEILKDIIEDESLLPSSIGVYGDWGSGKSSLIRMSRKNLKRKMIQFV